MDKRLTVDLPEETHKELLKLQLQEFIDTGKKRSLGAILKELVIEGLKNKKASQQ